VTVAHFAASKGPMTAEELLLLPDDHVQRELVRGQVVEKMPSGGRHTRMGLRISGRIGAHAESTGFGFATGADGGFILGRRPDTVRCPDAAYVAHERAGGDAWTTGFYEFAPDIAVEIVSPGDRQGEIEDKVLDYLSAGSKLIWVIYPDRRMAIVWRADSTVSFISEPGVLSGEDVLPALSRRWQACSRDRELT